MKVAAVGVVVRAYRKASGLSQKELAGRVGISRATLNVLESGRDIEMGAGKLLSLLEVLGIPFVVPGEIDRECDEEVIDAVLKSPVPNDADGDDGARHARPGKRLPRKLLVEAFTSGRVPIDYEAQLSDVLEHAPEPAVLAIVRTVCAASDLSAKQVWKNGRSLAKAVNCDRVVWRHGE